MYAMLADDSLQEDSGASMKRCNAFNPNRVADQRLLSGCDMMTEWKRSSTCHFFATDGGVVL